MKVTTAVHYIRITLFLVRDIIPYLTESCMDVGLALGNLTEIRVPFG